MSNHGFFAIESMYTSDYHSWGLQPKRQITPKVVAKTVQKPNYRPKQMDLEIMQPFKPDANVPFSLLRRRKEIHQINPREPIPNVKLEDQMLELKLKSRRERSVVYMVPQICLDDVPEDIMYGDKSKSGLVSNIYSSNWKKASQFAVDNSQLHPKSEKAKVTFEKNDVVDRSIERTRTKAASIVLPMEIGLAKYLPEWEKETPVEFVDTTNLFWETNKDKGCCSVCHPQPRTKNLTDEENQELESCLKEDALRAPYTLHPPGYTGYLPRLAVGIPFRKKKFTKYDTYVTSLMEAQGIYDAKRN